MSSVGSYLTGTPVVSQVKVLNCLSETLDNLLHGYRRIGTVSKDNINVWLLEALERALKTLDDVLLGEAASIGLLTAGTEEDLCNDESPMTFFLRSRYTFVVRTYSSLGQLSSCRAY